MLTIHLLEDMMDCAAPSTMERFRIKDETARGVDLLDEVCRGRGFLMRGGEYDYDRCQQVVLDEFRAGKLGRISLEKPPQKRKLTISAKDE